MSFVKKDELLNSLSQLGSLRAVVARKSADVFLTKEAFLLNTLLGGGWGSIHKKRGKIWNYSSINVKVCKSMWNYSECLHNFWREK